MYDFSTIIIDDNFCLTIPEDRSGVATLVIRISFLVEFPEVLEALDRINSIGSTASVVRPPICSISTDRGNTECNKWLKMLELVDYVDTVGPRTSKVNV